MPGVILKPKGEIMKLKLFIWTNFCPDYTEGLAFAIAKSEAEAKTMIVKEHGKVYYWGNLEVKSTTARIARVYVEGPNLNIAQKIYSETLNNGGATIDLLGYRPSVGFMVSESGGVQVPLDSFSVQDIEHVIAENKNALRGMGGYIGTWIDGDIVYIDYSVNLDSLGKALSFGRKHGQRAIFSLNTQNLIYL